MCGDQPGGHGCAQRGAAVHEDVSMAVRVGGALPAPARPRAFHLGQEGSGYPAAPHPHPPEPEETPPHVFIGGQVGGKQVGVEAREAQNGPDREETDDQLQCSGGRSQGAH